MRKLSKNQKEQMDFIIPILEAKDSQHKLDMARLSLKGSGWSLGRDHPRYGEVVHLVKQQSF